MKLNFRKLIASLPEGDVIAIRGDAEIDSVSGDTRRLRQGGVFVCLRGLHEDGHERIAEASELASAIVAEREDALTGDCGLPYAIVKNTRRALAYLAAALAGNPQKDLSLIAVTGTNGKTSTVQMLDCIFRGAGYRSAVIGTIAMAEMGGTMTTPDPEVLYARYVERDRKRSRHMGHTFIDRYPPLPEDDIYRSMTREYFSDRFENSGMAEFKLDGVRIDVDATYPNDIDVDELTNQIKNALAEV